MPSPDVYQFFYYLGTTAPDNTTTTGSLQGFVGNVSDTADGANDDSTDVGDLLYWDGDGTGNATLYGFTGDGDPILLTGSGTYFIVTNTNYGSGYLVSPVTSGTYTYCFGENTAIALSRGEALVQRLHIGDLVKTQGGHAAPVK